jgi:glycosyl transferase family 25
VIKPVNEWVDAVYVLSVRKYESRIRHVSAELARCGIGFSFVFEHDADDLTQDQIDQYFLPSDLKRTHQSLVMKNIHVWNEALAAGYKRILVFEDDVQLNNRFSEGFDEAMRAAENLVPGWLIFLGGMDAHAPSSYFRSAGPLVPLPLPTTEGCVLDREAIRRHLAWISHNKVRLPADHLMNAIDAETATPQYWLRHPVVEQGSVTGVFDSQLDQGRQRHGLRYNMLRYRWKRFCRRQLRDWFRR